MTEEILSAVNGQVFGVWFLIGAALVFWMQAGFAMVEADEKSDGFLYRHRCFHPGGVRPAAG